MSGKKQSEEMKVPESTESAPEVARLNESISRTGLPVRPSGSSSSAPAPKGGGRPWGWIFLAVVLVCGGYFLSRHRPAEPSSARAKGGAPPAPQITTATASKGEIGIYVNALGVVTPLNTVSLKTRVDGQLVKVSYKEGQMVHEGDLLAEIDPAPFQAALDQAEGQLDRDRALLENARVDLERYTEAYAKKAIPKQQLDTQVATVHQYQGTVKLDQGVVDNAKVQLGYCSITAPISGRIGLRMVDVGNIVHASDTAPLAVITELQPIATVFNVAEDRLPQIRQQLRAGKKLTVDLFDRAQIKKLATGTLETLDNQIDTSTGTVKLKAVFANDDEALFPNQFVNARLLVDTLHDATLLPNTVIQRNAQGAYVYLLNAGQTVAIQPVTAGTTDGNVTAVSDLQPGAVVAADNFNRLTDGAKVTLRPAMGEADQARPRPNGPKNPK